jgi:3-oxoacyl-[acyl-carrier protein] reductase
MAVEEIIKLYKPDIVINLAGVSHVQFVAGSEWGDWWDELETNLLGAYQISKAAIEVNPYVTLIHIGSVAGKYGKPQHSGYCASKAGVISLVQSLGKEGYEAYCISPGRVDTKMRESDYPGENKKTRLTTNDIARVVLEITCGKHTKGDNIIIRKRGIRTLRRHDRGEPWHTYLNVRSLKPGETPIKDI